jgi:xanthine dehydrogenase small subunit
MIRFLLDGEVVELDGDSPQSTALDLIRYKLRRTGTKEGCAEGDCGACTVLLGELISPDPFVLSEVEARSTTPFDLAQDERELTGGDRVQWRAVNACILFTPMLDGKALLTVESLSRNGALHPVQREMVERHGSQCGFCTPGFIMSLYGRSVGALGTEGTPVADVISGNLCRCTGYGPILASGEAIAPAAPDDAATIAALKTLEPGGKGNDWVSPATADELAALLIEHPDARIVAGATDVGLWVTKQHRDLGTMIFIGDVPDLRRIAETEEGLTIGAGVRYSEAAEALARLHPDLGELVRRIAGLQVRNAGTIGGNIANGSPIGDMPPALIALGATLTLRRGGERRTIPLESFFLSYGKQDRAPSEFVESVFIPRPAPDDLVRIVKLSKRFDSDISAVCGAFLLTIESNVVTRARIAFGGMAGIPARASQAEAALIGQPWSEATVEAAAQALAHDYTPLDDLRASSAYRITVAANLLRRLWIEQSSGEPTSVLDLADG